MNLITASILGGLGLLPGAFPVQEEVAIQGKHLRVVIAPRHGGTVDEFTLLTTGRNLAAGKGLLLEGFGTDSFYVPNRRLNETLALEEEVTEVPAARFEYDCEGANIRGLHVTRIMEPIPDETSMRVRWVIEHCGDEASWVSPWVRNHVTPGGQFDPGDRIDVPALQGTVQPQRARYYPAARNWIAVTDPNLRETVYGVFNADETYAFLTLRDLEGELCGFQTVFTPRILKPGSRWETTYRINVVRGLSHINFASDEIACQIDYHVGALNVQFAAAKVLPPVEVKASVRAADGRVWRLPVKQIELHPDRAARCAYDWTASAEGAYEFLAQLSVADQPYLLGKDTASPHGGIDAQFVVGSPRRTPMEAWTEAPYALDRGPRSLRRSMAVAGPIAIWFESSLLKVFPRDIPVPTGTLEPAVQLHLARNEYESFQVVIRPPEGTDLRAVNFQPAALVNLETGAKIEPSLIEISNVACYPVRVPTHFTRPTGSYPDALPPFEPFTARGGESSPVWVTVHAPPGIPAGDYVGLLEMSASGLDPVELWMEVTVYDFELPITPALKTDFGFWPGEALHRSRQAGYRGDPDALMKAYAYNALRHRVTLREPARLPEESADYVASLEAYEPRLKALLARGAGAMAVPASLLDTPEQLQMANAFVVKHGLRGRAFCHFAHEPLPPAWPRLLERMQRWRDAAPDIALMVTTFGLRPFLPEGLDIWGVHLPVFDTASNKTILPAIGNGQEVWWYVNHAPPYPYANFFVDSAAVEHRMLFWQAWALGIRGFHYWSVNFSERDQDPWENQLDITPANGDGFLVYPGPVGPVNSIRWETIRDGIEDYEYLATLSQRIEQLRKTGASPALLEKAEDARNLAELIPNLVNFTRDPNALQQKRIAIAAMIVQLGQAIGN